MSIKRKTNKPNALKIALFVVFGITILGITASLFGGLKRNDKDAESGTHKHSFEVVSTVPGTCTTPGSETVKCKTCFKTETRQGEIGAHDFTSNSLCKNCGFSENFDLIGYNIPFIEGVFSPVRLGEVELGKEMYFVVVLAPGTSNERLYTLKFNGIGDSDTETFDSEHYLTIDEDGVVYFVSDGAFYYEQYGSISLYMIDPNSHSDGFVIIHNCGGYSIEYSIDEIHWLEILEETSYTVVVCEQIYFNPSSDYNIGNKCHSTDYGGNVVSASEAFIIHVQ